MASNVQVSNRQRKVKIDTKWFTSAAKQLFDCVLDNVKNDMPEFLDEDKLAALSESGILSVVLVNNKEIQKLNKQWRDKDYATDVLSFPMNLDLDSAGEGVPLELGELVISVEKAREQSEEYAHSFERELCFLFVHGCLHILGFDHMNTAEEKDMFARQEAILQKCGYMR